MVEIIDITGRKGSFKCLACAITNKEIEDPFGFITVTKNFRVAHDFEYPIPGFIILSSWKHFQSIDEISSGERKEFIELLYNLRTALRQVLSIKTIYIIQKEDSSHFHVLLFPRYEWMDKDFGKKIESVRPIMEYSKENMNTKENLEEIEKVNSKLQDYFRKLNKK